ncbi:UNKNOWN [Stylonychia lemnae]|uniref:Transmembrane protein n=1 Tax=Stylonychia lemnae TaxID=5949 RepID=A0A078A7N9_STYLE|nr:UNKNOWN [Stylonychia lemnae]|eukprot:CDW76801.1 UNKNOWN [Stylonychia lemnae]
MGILIVYATFDLVIKNHIYELTSYFFLMILMIFVNALQYVYINRHLVSKRFSFTREKSKLVMATCIFTVSLLYRVIYNLMKEVAPDSIRKIEDQQSNDFSTDQTDSINTDSILNEVSQKNGLFNGSTVEVIDEFKILKSNRISENTLQNYMPHSNNKYFQQQSPTHQGFIDQDIGLKSRTNTNKVHILLQHSPIQEEVQIKSGNTINCNLEESEFCDDTTLPQ